MTANPFDAGSWLWKSFNAGWADVDQDPDAPKESLIDAARAEAKP